MSVRLGMTRRVGWMVVSVILVCLGLGQATFAWAAADEGVVQIFVFAGGEGVPLDGVSMEIAGGPQATSNVYGLVRFSLSPGSHAVTAKRAGLREAYLTTEIVSGEVTEVILTLFPDAEAQIEQEIPETVQGIATNDTSIQSPPVLLEGRVTSVEDGRPIASARVFVRGMTRGATTDSDGQFRLELPPGVYVLSVIHPDYATQSVQDVKLSDPPQDVLAVQLTPSSFELEEFTVVAPHIEGGVASLLEERRSSNAVSDIIGAEQIAKTGDSDAAGALKRVTGLTVMGGKYVYVRGMGERYSSTLLNGSSLPSPEPERRVVPLDMFPVGVLESLMIQKTYSPDLPGEFGGGTIVLRTKGRPEKLVANLGLSFGFKPGTSFTHAIHSERGAVDWLGIDDGSRSLPGTIAAASSDQALLESDMFSDRGYSADELENFGESMPNHWDIGEKFLPMDAGFNATVGDSFSVLGRPVGFFLSIGYANEWDRNDKTSNIYLIGEGGGLELQHTYDFDTTTNTVNLGGIFDMSAEISDDHSLKLTTLVLRVTDNETRIYQGRNRDVGTDIRVSRQRWVERMLVTQQVNGHHVFPGALDLVLDWRYSFSMATRDEPDRRETRYDYEEGTGNWILSDRPEGNQLLFSELTDYNHDVGLDLTLPFSIWRELESSAKIGTNVVLREREVDTRRYKYRNRGLLSSDPAVISQPAEDIFVPANIGSDGFQFEEITRQTDNYAADQYLYAGYAMADLQVLESLRLSAGLRVEHSSQTVRTFELFNPDAEAVEATLEKTDVLPATTLTWAFYADMQLRLGYSLTLSRPDFRELSPATFNDVTGGRQIFGNADLKRATIHNVDARYEWYFKNDENVSLAFFYKRFGDPIEVVIVPSAQQSITYSNAKAADNLGVEFEFRKSFDFAHKVLEDLVLSGNVTYIHSQVSLAEDSGIQTNADRPLQGQSPFVVNTQLGYDNADWGTSLTISYNVFGDRIVEVGAQGAPDVVEKPFHQLDFVASQKLPAGFKLSFKAKNLIDKPVRFEQGGKLTETYHRGRVFSLGVSWSY